LELEKVKDLRRELDTLKALQCFPTTKAGGGSGRLVADGSYTKCGTNIHGKKGCPWSALSNSKAHKKAMAAMRKFAEQEGNEDGDGEEGKSGK